MPRAAVRFGPWHQHSLDKRPDTGCSPAGARIDPLDSMTKSRDCRGVPGEHGTGARTTHSKSQLDMGVLKINEFFRNPPERPDDDSPDGEGGERRMTDHADTDADLETQAESLRTELRDADRTIGQLADEVQDKDRRIAELEAELNGLREWAEDKREKFSPSRDHWATLTTVINTSIRVLELTEDTDA